MIVTTCCGELIFSQIQSWARLHHYNGEILMSVIEDGEEYFTGNDIEHLQRLIDEIKPYLDTELDAVVLKYALSYTLQSLRNNENMNRFK